MANVKPGDIVRFLNSTGGGKVIRVTDKLAYVEDSDGFEVPVQLRECVVVDPAKSLGFTERPEILSKEKKTTDASSPKTVKTEEILSSIETEDGDVMNIVLGFEATNIKALSKSDFEGYLVNDSNYNIFVTIMTRGRDARMWQNRFSGMIEANMEEHVLTLGIEDLAHADRLAVQILAYKAGKPFELKKPIGVEQKLDTTKFAKLHCFRSHRYFESPVIALEIVRDDRAVGESPELSAERIADAMQSPHVKPADKTTNRPDKPRLTGDEPIVVDLHASELFDDMRGLSNADILNRQIDRFSEVMDAHMKHAGRKLIFIHGKGEGVLRQALMKELTHRYKGHDVQDASFREYGYGATQVTIRPMAAEKNKTTKR